MTESQSQQLAEEAEQQQRRCRDWLLRFMQDNQPRFLTKAELRESAMKRPQGVEKLIRHCLDHGH
jgi:hypothetical protein